MKITINESEKSNSGYPKLMIEKTTKLIIFATAATDKDSISGLVVSENETWEVGHFSYRWDVDFFEEFKGSITIEND